MVSAVLEDDEEEEEGDGVWESIEINDGWIDLLGSNYSSSPTKA